MSRTIRILVVFGKRNQAGDQIRTFLFGQGYDVTLTSGGQRAMLVFRDNGPFDVVIISFNLFYAKGERLVDVLRKERESQQFIIVTRDTSAALMLHHTLRISVTNIITLPINEGALKDRIERLCP